MKFNSYYKALNPEQKRAVDTVEGPVMVVAGPGTGKTQILTLRIANILRKTDVGAGNILALTFTEAAAASIRNRLVSIIGNSAYDAAIHTFHGFCNDIIKNYLEFFPRMAELNNITEVDQIRIIQSAITSLSLRELKPFGSPFYYLRSIIRAINDLKREGIVPQAFEKIIRHDQEKFDAMEDLYHEEGPYKGIMKSEYQKIQRNIKKNLELSRIYRFYEKELTRQRAYDYNDMIMEVVKELESNSELLLTLQEQYQYILVDEHQDTNNAQNRLLQLLTNFHDNPNIFVVGDVKQAIFRFQGASIENFNYFKRLYPAAWLIVLEKNYRSSQLILDIAHGVIPAKLKLKAKIKLPREKIHLIEACTYNLESYVIIQKIKELKRKGVPAHEIAVLYRDNRDVFDISDMLNKFGITHVIESRQNVLSDPDIKKLVLLLRTIAAFGSDEYLAQALHIDFLGFHPLDLYKLFIDSSKEKTSLYNCLRSLPKFEKFYIHLTQWEILHHNTTLLTLFETVIRESGFLGSILARPDMHHKLDFLNTLFDELKNFVFRPVTKFYGGKRYDATLNDFLAHLDILDMHQLLTTRMAVSDVANRVRLMTAHGAKGREFDYVFITRAHDGHWGNRRITEKITLPDAIFSPSGSKILQSGPDDDERRLFYVALTRARKGIYISYSKEGASAREQMPSRFAAEIRPHLIEYEPMKGYGKKFLKDQEVIFRPAQQIKVSVKDKEFIRSLFLENGLSVTGLNNYLACPWKYFYTNLLRIPEAKTKHQTYGTAVHLALKDFFDSYRTIKTTKKILLTSFEKKLGNEPLHSRDYKEVLQKGIKALSGYYDFGQKFWSKNILNEFIISGIVIDENIRINGKIDKIEIVDNNREVRVIDYKTSRPKSRKEIEGGTLRGTGGMKRQLVFYKLLLDNYSNGERFRMSEGVIEFIEPDARGRYHRQQFIISEEEVSELKKLVIKTAKDILSLSFWDKFCDDKECEYCALRRMMAGFST